jgi:plasmid stabilization system protein ParE
MAKRKIIWSARAEEELLHVLSFYNNRNGSTDYSAKLLTKAEKIVSLLTDYPELGHPTENKVTRVIVKGDFQIFYEVSDLFIEVVSFWDARQDPNNRIELLQ